MTGTGGTVLVTGGRKGVEPMLVFGALFIAQPSHVLVGCCPTGADLAARAWCAEYLPDAHTIFKADWHTFGSLAGPRRNAEMVAEAVRRNASVLAFPRGGSGTRDCIRQARSAGLLVQEF